MSTAFAMRVLGVVAAEATHGRDELQERDRRHFGIGGCAFGQIAELRLGLARWLCTSKPAMRAEPPSGSRKPDSIFMVVDLPAPLGPRKPSTSPGRTLREMPSTARNAPKLFLRLVRLDQRHHTHTSYNVFRAALWARTIRVSSGEFWSPDTEKPRRSDPPGFQPLG